MKKQKIDPTDPYTMELAFKAAAMRADLDDVFRKHGGRLVLGWEGKWAYMQVVFDHADSLAVTLLKVPRGGKLKLLTEVEER